MDNQIIQQAEKPIKPCKKCGSLEKYKDGKCKPCKKVYSDNWDKLTEEKLRTVPCEKCGEIDRDSVGKCKPCNRIRKKNLIEFNASIVNEKPCIKCGATDRNNSGECRYCRYLYNKAYRESKDKSKPCKKCGIIDWSKSGQCRPCSNDIAKKWYENNYEKAAANNKKSYEENNIKLIAYAKDWASKNKDKTDKYKKKYEKDNPEKVKLSKKLNAHTRRSQKLNNGGKLSKNIFDKLFILQRGKCAICHKDLNKLEKRKVHLDHIMPLALGGANEDYNIQLLCQTCNSKKSAKDPITYMQSLGKLL